MNMPDSASVQRMRVRRTLFALGGGVALTTVLVLLFARDAVRMDATVFAAAVAVFWLVNLGFLVAILSGRNLRLRDPSMTLAQMLWATVSSFAFLYFVDDARHLVLMVYLLAMMFGAFRLDVSEYLVVTLTALVLYALVIAGLHRMHPEVIRVRAEFLDWLVFFVVMVGFSLLGSETSRLRHVLQRRNHELQEARDAAAVAYHAKSRFLASTSHELRTPLTAILGACDLLENTRLGAEERDALTRARLAGLHLLALVNSMIDLSKLESGNVELRVTDLDLQSELETVRAMIELVAQERGLRFVLDLDPALERHVRGDGMRLNEVLVHLLNNAVKFTSRGEVRLAVAADPAAGADHARFEVRDTGQGIAPERVATLFRPFASTDGAGSGLGLALCRLLVDQMGGRLNVHSTPGIGSTFSFAVPLPRAAAPAQTTPPARESRKRVLIVDDSPDNRMLMRAFLRHDVGDLDEAENGARGVEMFRERHYDVVLMDMQMPVMGGLEATRAMRAVEAGRGGGRATILALTADDSLNDRERSLEAGCDDHVVKPVSKKVLVDLVTAGR